MEQIFWNDEWRENTEQTREQGRETPSTIDSSQNDNAGEKGQNQIHS
jgi:hypothetical protein